jgi:hypothetical protein
MAAVGAGELLLGREKVLMIEMFKIGNKSSNSLQKKRLPLCISNLLVTGVI